jgi:hypothetical protein
MKSNKHKEKRNETNEKTINKNILKQTKMASQQANMNPRQPLETFNNQMVAAIESKITGLSERQVKDRMIQRGLDPNALDDDDNERNDTYRPFFKMLRPKINLIDSIGSWSQKLERVVLLWVESDTDWEQTGANDAQLIRDATTLMPAWLKTEVGNSDEPSTKRRRTSLHSSNRNSNEEEDRRMFRALERWVLATLNAKQRQRNLNNTLAVGTEVEVTNKTLRRVFPNTHSMMPTEARIRGITPSGYGLVFQLSAKVNDRGANRNYNEDDAFDREVVHFEAKDDESSKHTSTAKDEQLKEVDVPRSDVYTLDEKVGVQANSKPLPLNLLPYYVRYVRTFTHLLDVLADSELVSSICDTLQEYYENKEYDAYHFNDIAQAKAVRWEENGVSMREWEGAWGDLHDDDDTTFVGLMESLQDAEIKMDLQLGDENDKQ